MQLFGETFNPGDDMPGFPLQHVNFSSVLYHKCRSCGWVTMPSSVPTTSGLARYHTSGGVSNFDIWTDPL